MPNPFLDDEAADEAFDDDHEEEEEEEEEEDVRTDLDEFSDEETMQDHDKLQLLEDKPHHMRYNEWLETLASISNKYERSSTTLSQGIVDVHRLPQLQNSTERDDLRAAVNQVPDSQLRGILRLDEGPSFWRLKCKASQQHTLLYDILTFFKPASPLPSANTVVPSIEDAGLERWSHTPSPSREFLRSKMSKPRARAWNAIQNYITSKQSIPQIHAELEEILKDEYDAADWHAAIAAGTSEGDDYDDAQAAVYKLAAADGYPLSTPSMSEALSSTPPPLIPLLSSLSVPSMPVFTHSSPIDHPEPTSQTEPGLVETSSTCNRAQSPLFLPSPTSSTASLPTVEELFRDVFKVPSSSPFPDLFPLDSASPHPTAGPSGVPNSGLIAPTSDPGSPHPNPHPNPSPIAGPTGPSLSSLRDPDPLPTTSSAPPMIRAAFCIPQVVDCIYLEGEPDFHPGTAKALPFTTFLRQHSAVHRLKHGNLNIARVPTGEVADLLQWVPSIEAHTWIRVVKKGMFHSDVGLVSTRERSGGRRHLRVLLIPRPTVQSGQKRKSERPPLALLHHGSQQELFTGRGNDDLDYECGLVVLSLGYGHVTHKDVVSTDEARYLFTRSGHPLLLRCPIPAPDSWTFGLGEVVFSVQSEMEKKGTVKSVELQQCLVAYEDTADEFVAKRNLRKSFRSHDTVVVTHGVRTGEHGVIVASYWETCEIALLRGNIVSELVVAHVNHCRRDCPRDGGGIPWINEHVTVCWGEYFGYTGVVKDSFPPCLPNFLTKVEVWIPRLTLSVKLNHNDVYHTITKKTLKDALPLTAIQQHFRQPDWNDLALSNVVLDPLSGRRGELAPASMRTPPEPWINKIVRVTYGPMKLYTGRVVRVNRAFDNLKYRSGLRVTVQFDQIMLYSRGTGAQEDFDYNGIIDCETGECLNQAYPLRGYQRFYEPEVAAIQTNPKPLSTTRQENSSWRTPSPPPSSIPCDGGAWDPGSMTPLVLATVSTHWTMHPNLDSKSFLSCYKPPSGQGREWVHATPDRTKGQVNISYQQKDPFPVPPEHIVDITGKHAIKPSCYQGGMLAVRGPLVGKYLRRIHIQYDDDQHWKDPWMSCMVFGNWGTDEEYVAEDYVLVDVNDCAPCDERKLVGDLAQHLKMVREVARKRVQRPRPDPSQNQHKRPRQR